MEFQKIVKSFTEKFDEVSKLVEKEKMKVWSLIKTLIKWKNKNKRKTKTLKY